MFSQVILAFSALLVLTSSAQSEIAEPSPTDSSSSSDPVVSLFLPMADPQPLVASVISSKPSATIYLISCPEVATGDDTADCGFDPPQTVTEGPSTAAATYGAEGYYAAYGCKLSGTTMAVCTTSVSGTNLGTVAGKGTTTLMQSEIQYLPVTVTEGGEGITSAKTGAASASTTNDGQGGTLETGAFGSALASASVAAASTIASAGGAGPTGSTVAQATASSTGGAGSVAVQLGAMGAGMVGALAALI